MEFKYEFKSSEDSEPPKPIRITNKKWFLGDDFGLSVTDLNTEG